MTSRFDCLNRLGNTPGLGFLICKRGGRKEEGKLLFIFICFLSEWALPLLRLSEVSPVGNRSEPGGELNR